MSLPIPQAPLGQPKLLDPHLHKYHLQHVRFSDGSGTTVCKNFHFQATGVSRERFPFSPIRGTSQLVPEVVKRTLWTSRY